jgi:NADH:ubiquinone oxidoreductase subunit D
MTVRADGIDLMRSVGASSRLPGGRGHMLADVSAILGSIDIVLGEVDR